MVLGLGATLGLASVTAAADLPRWKQPDYVDAIVRARDGDVEPALALLEAERAAGPLPLPLELQRDTLTLRLWQGRPAVALQDWLDWGKPALGEARTYTLLARGARDAGDLAHAAELYRLALALSPQADAYAGLAMVQAEGGDFATAQAVLDAAEAGDDAGRLQLARARGYVLSLQADLAPALGALLTAMDAFPGDEELQRLYVRVLLRLGAANEALDFLRDRPRLDRGLLLRAQLDAAAIRSRWGRSSRAQERGDARYADTDRALRQNQAVRAELTPAEAALHRSALDDRLQMLSQRGRYRQLLAEYAAAGRPELSPYGKAVVADAYLTLEQPEDAARLYRQAVDAAPPGADELADWFPGWMYAELESGRVDAAWAVLRRWQDAVPRTRREAGSGQRRFNPDALSAQLAEAMLYAYTGDTQHAAERLAALSVDAPYNAELRKAQGELALLRGWPRRAQAQFQRLLVDEPDSLDARLGLGAAALELGQWADARAQLEALRPRIGDEPRWERLNERLAQETAPQWVSNAGRDLSGAKGDGQQRAWDAQTRLYGAAQDGWRLFAQHDTSLAHFSDLGTVRRERAGLGLALTPGWGRAELGLTASLDGSRRGGGFAGVDWTPDDVWTLSLRHEEDSPATPLKGSEAGLHGRLTRAALAWRRDEGRSLTLDASVQGLSDGNRRQTLALGWDELWWRAPGYQLQSTLSARGSRGRDVDGAAYFNPRQDGELGVELVQDFTLWSRYERRWLLRLGSGAGRYWQQDYGSGSMWNVYVEQELQWGRRFDVRLGLSRSRHPYDGEADYGSRVYLGWDWRF